MLLTTLHPDISYRLFLKNLESLLKKSGVTPSRRPVTANINRNENGSGISPEAQPTVGRIVTYIEEHLAEPLSLEKLAGQVHLSKYQLIRGFREEKGTTPWKFLIKKRIDKVKKLLENGTPPGQAAVETGFYDQSHLNKAFREETGLTPKEYQEINFKNKN